jgi:signal transduction histidine kinase
VLLVVFAIGLLGTIAATLLLRAFSIAPVTPALRPPGAALALLLIAIVALLGLRGLRRFASPVDQLAVAAGRIEAGDYSARVGETGPPEVRAVARAFNEMTAHLAAAEERRRGFLAGVAHEFRTPLSVIRGQAEAIADGVYPPAPEHLAPILDAVAALEVLVEDLRTLALTEAGALRLERESVEPEQLVEEAIAAVKSQADAGRIKLASSVEGAPAIDADPIRARSILVNLLSNAVRHTPGGGTVSIAAQPEGDFVEFRVADTGAGMPPELAAQAFERFVKGPGSRGSGLGLAIARELVLAHGGRIDLDSREGRGTKVRFTLPIAKG